MRVVLDTNVLVSGAAGFLNPRSKPRKILQSWKANEFQLIISNPILLEVASTLQKPYFDHKLSTEQITSFLNLLKKEGNLIRITTSVSGVATHPEDDLILATAMSGKADYLVTGDKPLRKAVPLYKGVKLVTPDEFLKVLERLGEFDP